MTVSADTDAGRSASAPRIALVHEWLVVPAGSEQVLRALHTLLPTADLFCVVDGLTPADREALGVGHPRTTWLQRLPGATTHYQRYLPLMPWAIGSLDLRGYDLVISSSHAVAKGVRVPAGVPHLCYCHSPMRYAWDLRDEYLLNAGLDTGLKRWAANALLDRLQQWDRRTAQSVTTFIANSAYVADRIARAYGRDSTVVHPPVDTDFFRPDPAIPRGTHYVTASRLVGYKRIPDIIAAFRELPDRQLTVVGDGPEWDRARAVAGPNVTLLGRVSRERLREELRRARAFLFAAEEDFGIAPVEAQGCGTPVIALGRGGALETVVGAGPHATGRFFAESTPGAIAEAVRAFEAGAAIDASACRRNAERFSADAFAAKMQQCISHYFAPV